MKAVRHFFLFLSFPTAVLLAHPTKMQVVEGEANLKAQDHLLEVSVSDRAVLHWDSFSIQPGETTRFLQPSIHSAVLNRVIGTEMSQLLGQLQANGQVYLINPNGVVIGKEGRIDTAGFIASALDVRAEEFLNGNELFFAGDSENGITHLGTIETASGPVALLGHKIENRGAILARKGSVSLLAGHEILLDPTGDALVYISPDQKALGIENTGSIEALKVRLEADTPASLAIGQGGPIHLVREGGKIFFRAIEGDVEIAKTADLSAPQGEIFVTTEQGTCEVRGLVQACGGEVRLLGKKVHLLDQAEIDVSDELGGGTALLGGDYQGKNPDIANADYVFMSPEATIKANAKHLGHGGKVILWGEKATSYYGYINVSGGPQGGDGGLAEVSGEQLEFRGLVNATAPLGKTGTLLLDPTNITIGSSSTTGTWSTCGPPINYNKTSATSNNILNTDLQTQLGLCNVTITTASGAASAGTISVTSAVTWATANTLTLNANSTISISAAISNTSTSTGFTAMNFTAAGVGGGATTPGIFLSGINVLTTNGGDIILSGTSSASSTGSAHGVHVNGSVSTTSGNVSVTGVVPSGATGTSVGILFGSPISSSSGSITVSGSSAAAGSNSHGVSVTGIWSAGTSGTLTFTNCVASGGSGSGISNSAQVSCNGSIIGTNNIQGSSSGGSGIAIGSSFSSGGNLILTAKANSTTGMGINITAGTVQTGAGNLTLTGTTSSSGSTVNGVYFNGGTASTTTGTISINGVVPLGASGACCGVKLNTANALTSFSGDIQISGTSFGAGSTSHGVSVTASCTTGTTGTLIFSNCRGGLGTNSDGVSIATSQILNTKGNIVATSSIIGGSAAQSDGFAVLGTLSSAGGNIAITATTAGGSGIHLSGTAISTTGSGSIQLVGQKTAGTTTDSGIEVVLGGIITVNGNISLTGTAAGGGSFPGITLSRNLSSTSGNITVSGSSTATGANSHGVLITTTSSGSNSTGIWTFTNCQGGSGANSHGISVESQFTAAGRVIATNSILSGTGSGSIGFNGIANFSTSGAEITIAALSQGSGTGSHGISISSGVLSISSGSGIISLNGTSSSSSTGTSHGVDISGTGEITTLSGALSLTGTVPSSATGTSYGISMNVANGVTSTSGPINLSGTSNATGSNSYGVSVAAAWTTGTTGTLTFTNCQGGASGDGLNIAAAISTSGAILVQSTQGGSSSGNGLTIGANVQSTGNGNISMTALANGTSSHGISLTAGTVSTGSGTLILNGTSSSTSSGSSNGISISGTGIVTTTSGLIQMTGIVPSGATGTSVGILMNVANGITSTSGPITLSGTSNATGSNSHGISLTAAWTTGTSAALNLTGANPGGGTNSFPIAISSSLTSSGPITFNSALGLVGTPITITQTGLNLMLFSSTIDGLSANSQDLTLAANAGPITLSGSLGGTTPLGAFTLTTSDVLTFNSSITATSIDASTIGTTQIGGTAVLTTNNGIISFGGTLNGSNDLTLNAGTGAISVAGIIGGVMPLGALTVSTTNGGTGFTFGSNITAASLNASGVSKAFYGADATISTIGDINFGGSLDGAHALSLSTSSGSITVSGSIGASSAPTSLTANSGSNMQIGGASSSTSLNLNASGAFTLSNGGSITTGSPANGLSLTINSGGNLTIGDNCTITIGAGMQSPLTIQAPSASISIGNSPTITTDGSLLILAGQNITAAGTGLIQTSSSTQNVNLVVDNLYPNPPSFGSGAFAIPNLTLCTDSCSGTAGKVYLYASRPGINSFPSVINTASYTPGTLTSTSYIPGTNEFVGYWYITQPPPDPPLFEVVFKSALPPSPPLPSPATVQKIQVATTESLNNNAVSTQVLQANNSTPQQDLSAPDPKASCAPPSVSIQAL